jgi:hypothetical protein
MSAAGAALQLHEELKVDTELWVSGGRTEGGGNTILNSIRAMCCNIAGFRLIESGLGRLAAVSVSYLEP